MSKLTRVRALKAFPYAHDGINAKDIAADAILEVHTDVLDSMVRAGQVSTDLKKVLAVGDDLKELGAAALLALAKTEFNVDLIQADEVGGFRGHVRDLLLADALEQLRALDSGVLIERAKPLFAADTDLSKLTPADFEARLMDDLDGKLQQHLQPLDAAGLLAEADKAKVEVVPARVLKKWRKQIEDLRKAKAGDLKTLV